MALSKVLIHRNPQFARCPACKKVATLKRSRSHNAFEMIVRRTKIIKTYRCSECGWRGFRSTVIITKKSVGSILIYLAFIIVTAFIARYFILNYTLN